MSAPFAWTDAEVRRALGLPASEQGGSRRAFTGIGTDSRSVDVGELFVALVGESFDGHDFVERALDAGAAGAVVSGPVAGVGEAPLYRVDDTLKALGALARHRRRSHGGRVVGITGSSGKTTTKELTRAALEGRWRVHANPGNLNNRVGLPRTLLEAPEDAQVLVLEMGTNEPGEIRALTEVAEPDMGVVTTVSEAHLEKLGTLEGVMREKLALVEGLPPAGKAVVGDEPPTLADEARERCGDVTVAGWSPRAEVRPQDPEMESGGRWSFGWEGERVELRIPGRHTVQNALLALAVARHLEVDPVVAARGVSGVEAAAMRSEIRSLGGITLLVDCYNANPQSVAAALDVLTSLPGAGRRVAVLGSMLELGERSEELHRRVLGQVLAAGLDLVVATGAFADAADQEKGPRGDRVVVARDPEEAYPLLRDRLRGDEAVLLKASRGVALERLVPLLEADFGPDGED